MGLLRLPCELLFGVAKLPDTQLLASVCAVNCCLKNICELILYHHTLVICPVKLWDEECLENHPPVSVMKNNLPSVLTRYISQGLDLETTVTVRYDGLNYGFGCLPFGRKDRLNYLHLWFRFATLPQCRESYKQLTIPRLLLLHGTNVKEYSQRSDYLYTNDVGPDDKEMSYFNHKTALHLAFDGWGDNELFNRLTLVSLLLESCALENAEDSDQMMPLHYAVHTGDQAVIRMLLEYGADVNAITSRGMTPLLEANGVHPNIETIQLLLDAGASVDVKHLYMATPLDRLLRKATMNPLGHRSVKRRSN
jgi:ankyrin repeat protein